MEGTGLTKKEKISKLADEFDRFTSEKRRDDSFILYKNEPNENEVRAMKARFPDPLALIANTYNPPSSYSSYKSRYNPPMPFATQQPYIPQPSYEPPTVYQQPPAVYQQPPDRPTSPDAGFLVPTFLPTDDLIASLNKVVMFLTTAISSRYPSTNNQRRISSNPRTQANIQNGRVVVLNVQGRQAQGYGNAGRGRGMGNIRVVRTVGELSAIPPKETMLLAQQQEVEIEIDAEHQEFYDGNVISDNPYPDNNENEVVQEMASLAQNDVAILLLIENMQHEVTRCNMVNLESKQINEQLTIELDRYTKQVKVLEFEKKNQLVFTFTEKDLDSQMQKLIVTYNNNEEAFNKEILILKGISFTE
ncbi:hypothetical protein Tco_1120540 [Tanacetum coccineum]